MNNHLNVKFRQSNDELQEARKELIDALKDMLSINPVFIGIKRMGELDWKLFRNACMLRYPAEADTKAAELITLWEERIEDPGWPMFRVVTNENGNSHVKMTFTHFASYLIN